jgi:hypothetical protein
VNVEGGTTPDGTYADGYTSYAGLDIAAGDPAWQRFVTYQVDKIVHDGEYDGVFLDTDANPAAKWTGSSGAEYMLENANLYRHGGAGWSWTPLGQAAFARNDTVVEAAIPISSLDLSPGRRLRIGFLKNNSTTERLPAATGTFPTITLPGS